MTCHPSWEHASVITVVSGHGSPASVVAVDGMDDEAIRAALSRKNSGKTDGAIARE